MAKFLVYYYEPITGEYKGTGWGAKSDREDQDHPLIPVNSTIIPPLPTEKDEIAVWDKTLGIDGGWKIVPDFRDHTYYSVATGEVVSIPIGEEPNEEEVTLVAPGKYEEWNYGTGQWEIPLATAKNLKEEEIKFSRSYTIENASISHDGANFSTNEISRNSFASAIAYFKESDPPDPSDIPFSTIFWQTIDGFYLIDDYDVLGIILGKINTFVTNMSTRQTALLAAIQAATTVEEVRAITWKMNLAGAPTAPNIEIPDSGYSF